MTFLVWDENVLPPKLKSIEFSKSMLKGFVLETAAEVSERYIHKFRGYIRLKFDTHY